MSDASIPPSPSALPSGADRLRESFSRVSASNPQGAGRHKRDCSCGRCASANSGKAKDGGTKHNVSVTQPSTSLPPGVALPQVMGSGAALFFNIHASLLDDPAWNISPEVKAELGNILSWMLADDFYKLGGVGKYVVGGILCLSVYAIKAAETAPNRNRKAAIAKLAKNGKPDPEAASVQSQPPPIKKEPENESVVQGPVGRLLSDAAPKQVAV